MQEGATEEEFDEGVRILAAMRKVGVTDEIVRSASTIPGRHLRSLDAFHVASAIEAGATVLVTYDKNMAAAARGVGLKVVSPGLN
jgi:predicted nucleic acid-binding protein